jgi:hypothetical protein
MVFIHSPFAFSADCIFKIISKIAQNARTVIQTVYPEIQKRFFPIYLEQYPYGIAFQKLIGLTNHDRKSGV